MTEEHSLLTGSVPKRLAVFAFPLLLANILQSFYNVADMLVIGQIVGDTGLAAIGNASKLCYIINSICIGMTMDGADTLGGVFRPGEYLTLGRRGR